MTSLSGAYRAYLLALLIVVQAFNYTDRLAMALLLDDIKVDLGLSDTQLGLLTGIAFALFYSIMGIPIARWCDRGNRITIISATTALWSAAVAMCGIAANFVQLLLIRVGVAVGEAGCIPPAHSLIADYFSRSERPRAVAIYMLGGPLSFVLGYFVSGWLNEMYGWRVTFILMGLPGLGLAALVRFTLKDPREVDRPVTLMRTSGSLRLGLEGPGEAASANVSLRRAFTLLWATSTFRHLLFSWSIVSFFGYGVQQWQPTFFIRSFGLEPAALGSWLAVIFGLSGLVGLPLGGELASRYAANDEGRQLRAMATAYAVFSVLSICIYLASSAYAAFCLVGLAAVGAYATYGPMFSIIQTLVPSRMRAVSIAIVLLFANLIGMGLGPLVVGILSDSLRSVVGEESLRYSLMILCPGYLWAAWHLWRGSATVQQDLLSTQHQSFSPASLRDSKVIV